VDAKVYTAVETLAEMESAGELALKGFHQPVKAFNVVKLKLPSADRSATG
jgi:class 3 adenylate cyclase